MAQALLWFAQALIGGVQFGVACLSSALFIGSCLMNAVWMNLRGQIEKLLFEGFGIEPRPASLVEQVEIVGHSPLRAETFAAGATGGRVWICYFEAAVKGVEVVEFAASDVEGALGIDDDA